LNNDTTFARLVSLACHDLRTPLATVNGFARTLERTVELEAPADRYVEMIVAAVAQLDELLDELSLVARIEADRYDPNLQEVDTLALARAAADRLGEDRVKVEGEGAPEVEPVTDSSSKVVLGQDLRDLGAAVAVRLLERLGGAVEVDGSSLKIHLPQ